MLNYLEKFNRNILLNQNDESLILTDMNWIKLRYKSIEKGSFCLRSKVLAITEGNCEYIEDLDFIMDYDNGKIRRTTNSYIRNWSEHVFFNQTNFNHTLYEKYSNEDFTLYCDYKYTMDGNYTIDEILGNTLEKSHIKTLEQTVEKIKKGEHIKYLVFGDSISTGAEASVEENKYYNRFTESLRRINPEARVDIYMKAIGGEASRDGVKRLQEDVINLKPDLVSIGYGMNDQNKDDTGGHCVELVEFEKNIIKMIEEISSTTSAEIVLITACIPNPQWKWSSGDAELYADIIRKIGLQYNIAVADVQAIWLEELKAGKSHEALLLNNINHPNDYGHWLYYKTLESLLPCPRDNYEGYDTDVTQVDWKAEWIWKPGGIKINDFSYFRKIINITKPISSCKVYISAHNHYELFVNAKKVGGYVSPAPSHPVKSKLYLTYDITTLLVDGRNSFCAVVHYLGGDGQNYVNGKPGLLLQGEIVYEDATRDIFVTDTTWKCTGMTPYESQTTFQQNRRISAIESYNACLELEGWMEAEYTEEQWENAVLSAICSDQWILKPQMIPEGVIEEAIIPKLCGVQQLGTQVFDAGKIVTGWPRIRLEGIKGVKIRLRYSEDLDECGRVRHYVANETSEFYYDEYLMKGVGVEVWEPSFSYKAFRYVEITGLPRMLDTGEIAILCAHTFLDYKGYFHCSERILNEIYAACINTQKNNVTGQMVDCPHREQAQYLADADLQVETFGYNFLNPSVLEKVLSDFQDAQERDGTFPFVFPSNYEHPDFKVKIPEWDLHYCTLLWKIYNLYGDKRILQRYYPTAKRMVDFYLATIDNVTGLIPKSKDWHISDWPYSNIDQSGSFLTVQNCKLYHVLNIIVKIAEIKNLEGDLKCYSEKACKLKNSIIMHLYDPKEKKIRDSMNSNVYSQGTNVVACGYGLVPEGDLEVLLDYIANQQLNCSTLLTIDLLRLLFEHGKQEAAMNILRSEEYPGWGYMMKKGYKTIWEGFQNIESHCHAWNAYPARIMAEYLVGIRLISPGFERVEIKPFMPEQLEFAEAKVPTIRGIIHVRWQRIGNLRKLFVTIPTNVCAAVVISDAKEISKIEESGVTLWGNGEIHFGLGKIDAATLKENEIIFELKCGDYTFIICD